MMCGVLADSAGPRRALKRVLFCLAAAGLVRGGATLTQAELTGSKTTDTTSGQWWKGYLTSAKGNHWFLPWNSLMQAKFDELSKLAEAEAALDESKRGKPYQILMVGDSTMKHQHGAVCGFLAERTGVRFDPMEGHHGISGCCVDTAEGGGRGLCFAHNHYRFLNPAHAGSKEVDAYYFGCGLHILHATPERPLEALRTQEWLAYEHLLEATVAAVREKSGPSVKVVFMTTHTVADEVFIGAFAEMRDAYRKEPGNSTIQEACHVQIEAVVNGDPTELPYPEGNISLQGYRTKGAGEFVPETYCAEGLLDGHGTIQLNRRALPTMVKLGVPVVDAGRMVEGQVWATRRADGRHFHPIVPLELYDMLAVITSPAPPLPCA